MSGRRGCDEGSVVEPMGRLRADGSREPSRWVPQITLSTPEGPKRATFYGATKREVLVRLEEAKIAKWGARVVAGVVTNTTLFTCTDWSFPGILLLAGTLRAAFLGSSCIGQIYSHDHHGGFAHLDMHFTATGRSV